MLDHEARLSVSARAEPGPLKVLAEAILLHLPEIEVLENRTGLVMMPLRDTVTATDFHLGEALVAEAHIRAGEAVGYGVRMGRDLEAAMAMAILDLAVDLGIDAPHLAAFYSDEKNRQDAEDTARLRDLEATRVDMETF